MVWPSASRAWDLLNGVKMDNILPPQFHDPARYKRPADDAFGHERRLPQQVIKPAEAHHEGENGVQDLGSRIMAHMFGFHVPGVEPSTSFLPGYEWWPRPDASPRLATHPESPNLLDHGSRVDSNGRINVDEWPQIRAPDMNYPLDFGRF